MRITSTFSYQADVEMRETKKAQEAVLTPKVRRTRWKNILDPRFACLDSDAFLDPKV